MNAQLELQALRNAVISCNGQHNDDSIHVSWRGQEGKKCEDELQADVNLEEEESGKQAGL